MSPEDAVHHNCRSAETQVQGQPGLVNTVATLTGPTAGASGGVTVGTNVGVAPAAPAALDSTDFSFGANIGTKEIQKAIQNAVDGLQKAIKDFVVYVRTGVRDSQQQVQDGLDGKQSIVTALVNALAAFYRQFGRGINAYTNNMAKAAKLAALEASKLKLLMSWKVLCSF